MVKIIAQKIKLHPRYYAIVFSNEKFCSKDHIALIVQILQDRELDNAIDGIVPECNSDWLIIRHGMYCDDYYLGFYDPRLDPFVEEICEKKYGQKGFVWDNDTPMLRFSKKNFEHLLKFWETVKNNTPHYYIITQDDHGWIDVQAKNELSLDDQRLVQQYAEHKEKLRQEESERAAKREQEFKKHLH